LSQFQNRADTAEKHIEILTRRLEYLETLMANNQTKEKQSDPLEPKKSNDNDISPELLKKMSEVTEERDALKVENAKLKYRITHLKRSLEEEEEKLFKLTMG